MSVGERHIADIARLEVECAGQPRAGEYSHPAETGDVVLPLVVGRVPVQLAQAAGLDLHEGGGDGGGRLEDRGVDDADGPAGEPLRRLCEHPVFEGAGYVAGGADDPVGVHARRHLTLEDVLLLLGHVGHLLWRPAEVLGEDALGGVGEPVAHHEGGVLGESAVVEDQQELHALVQRLDVVRHALGEEPQVALLHVVEEVAALLVDGADAATSLQHVPPLGLLVPVQLTVGTGIELHVHTGQRGGDRQLPLGDLARPAALLDASVRHGEGELHVGNGAAVGLRRREQVGVLQVQFDVAGPGVQAPLAVALRMRDALLHGLGHM